LKEAIEKQEKDFGNLGPEYPLTLTAGQRKATLEATARQVSSRDVVDG